MAKKHESAKGADENVNKGGVAQGAFLNDVVISHDDGIIRSTQFDDVYFSVHDGLSETNHVFIDGNNLRSLMIRHQYDLNRFVICETGFGTGLNLMAVCAVLDEILPQDTHPQAKIHFISFEKYPLRGADIDRALSHWNDDIGAYKDALCAMSDGLLPHGGTVDINDRVRLTLHIGDINAQMPKCEFTTDAWFLDGFKPSSNPDMWSDTVFTEMARLSKVGTTLATFTAAGFVRRGLQAAGFEIEKCKGFGRKREMVVGRMV